MDLAVHHGGVAAARFRGDNGVHRWIRLALRVAEEWLAHGLGLGIRLLLASVFFKAGLTKIASWSTTLALFENEYAVPFLPPEIAAYVGTGVELLFPVLLVLGLGSRVAAAVLFVFNIIAVVSYPDLSEVGLMDHRYWGLLLLVTLLYGPGKLSLDHLIRRRFLPEVKS
jgi:putative oxidoreductase